MRFPIYKRPVLKLLLCGLLIIALQDNGALAEDIPSSNLTAWSVEGYAARQMSDNRQGFTPSPPTRGTLDILWNCLTTLTLASWSVLCLNVPKPNSRKRRTLATKAMLTVCCALGPEFLCLIVIGQYVAAHRTTKLFKAAAADDHGGTHSPHREAENWTITHSFYAEMGGFLLQPADGSKMFPVDGQQLHYLYIRGFVDFPRITAADIKDKNKTDGLLRLIAFCQTMWFVANLISRPIQHLAITSLELTTVAFVFFAAITSFFWYRKPADVTTFHRLEPPVDVERVLQEEGRSMHDQYNRTPLDFVWDRTWKLTSIKSHGLTAIARFLAMRSPIVPGYDDLPVTFFRNFQALPVEGWMYALLFSVTYIYFAILTLAWYHPFPTRTEQNLYRASCITCFLMGLVLEVALRVDAYRRPQYKARRERRRDAGTHELADEARYVEITSDMTRSRAPRDVKVVTPSHIVHETLGIFAGMGRATAQWLRNNTTNQDPTAEIYIPSMVAIYFLWTFYCSARLFIIIDDFAELRSLEPSAYQSVDWSRVLPHIQ